jgi:hypothetical protein
VPKQISLRGFCSNSSAVRLLSPINMSTLGVIASVVSAQLRLASKVGGEANVAANKNVSIVRKVNGFSCFAGFIIQLAYVKWPYHTIHGGDMLGLSLEVYVASMA